MFRRFPRRRIVEPPQLEALAAANRLRTSGHPGQAAAAFTQVARSMEANQHPRRAANTYAQASHAYVDAGDEPQALEQARNALNLFLRYGMVERTPVFLANITRKMANHGMAASAQALQDEYGAKAGPLPAVPAPSAAKRGRLPAACPKCGAPVRSDEVSWVDASSAECIYCGAILQAE